MVWSVESPAAPAIGSCLLRVFRQPAHVPSPCQQVVLEAFVPLLRLVTGRFPLTSALARFTAELVAACVLPAKWAMPTPGEEEVTQVGQVMVPIVVIVPPLIGEVVATLLTLPTALAAPLFSLTRKAFAEESYQMKPLLAAKLGAAFGSHSEIPKKGFHGDPAEPSGRLADDPTKAP
jgi:hypothetical protein